MSSLFVMKGSIMYSWSTTTEWIAFQFHDKYIEDLNATELNIVNRLIEEGYLQQHITNSNNPEEGFHKLSFIHSSN